MRAAVVLGTILLAGCSGERPFTPSGTTATRTAFLVAAGDIADCSLIGAELTAQIIDQSLGTVLAVGDNAYPLGRDRDFRDCYHPTWGRHLARTRPAPGNHDYDTPGAQGYFSYFGAAAGPAGQGYYSFRHGSWLVISLNSEVATDRASAQYAWLRGELSTTTVRCTLAYWHKPLFSSGQNGDNPHMRDIWRVLQEFDADVIIAAHDHLYERFAPQDADGRADSARGIRQFTVGTGGARLTTPVRVAANSQLRFSEWGVLRLTLSDGSYGWEFVAVEGGAVRDAGTGSCH